MNIRSFSQSTKDGRCLEIWFANNVTDTDRAELLKALNDARRYQWLRERDLETIYKGGVFAGITPQNMVINLEDLDRHIDEAMAKA